MKEQFAKVTVIIERTYLLPIRNGKTVGGYTPEELKEEWFGKPEALNRCHVSRDGYRLGGSDIIKSAEIVELIDLPDGTL